MPSAALSLPDGPPRLPGREAACEGPTAAAAGTWGRNSPAAAGVGKGAVYAVVDRAGCPPAMVASSMAPAASSVSCTIGVLGESRVTR
jgi:hypothetical protein